MPVWIFEDEDGETITADLENDQINWKYKCGCFERDHDCVDCCPIHNEPSYRLEYE